MAKKKFDWYKVPMVERARMANELGLKSSQIINKALERANKLLAPYGYAMKIDLHFCELEKPQEIQTVNPES